VVGGVPARPIRRRFATVSDESAHIEMLAAPASSGEYCRPVASYQEG
jgi:hypothetical protein